MKSIQILLFICASILVMACNEPSPSQSTSEPTAISQPESVLRHVVVFKFNDDASEEAIETVNVAFEALQKAIPQIKDFEWGLNNSPEGLDQDFTHVYTVTFHSEKDREIYLPHPAHKAFVESIGLVVEKAFVVDYWTK